MDKSSTEKLIQVDREPNGIAFVTINRPKSLNSLTKSMITDLARAFKSLDGDESVRVIVLSGSGRAFCSGVDLTAAEDVFKGDVKDLEKNPVYQMELCRKPIIGAISGFAVTAGFEIALACDILIAAKGAKFMDTHARFGIFPSWGLSQKLARIIGPNRAREASLTAIPITAVMAERWGLVNHVVEGSDLLKKAREVAEAIIRNNQDMVLRYKSVINDGLKLDLGHALALEKERGHNYYDGMSKEDFEKMQKFIAGRRADKPSSKMMAFGNPAWEGGQSFPQVVARSRALEDGDPGGRKDRPLQKPTVRFGELSISISDENIQAGSIRYKYVLVAKFL